MINFLNNILSYFSNNYIFFFFKKDNFVKKNEYENINTTEDEIYNYPEDFFCPICINTLSGGKNQDKYFFGRDYIHFECNHYMHFKCLFDYMPSNNICPLCKKIARPRENDFDVCRRFIKYVNSTKKLDDFNENMEKYFK